MGWKCGGCGDRGPEHNAVWCPSCGERTPTPTDQDGFTAADWLGQGTEYGDAMYERARRIIRFRDVDPEIALVFRGDDAIGRVFYIERLARRCARLGIAATVIVPIGNDFNDDLVDFGAAALRARFAPLFRAEACAPASQAEAGSRSGGGREERRVGQADPKRGGRGCARS